MSERHPERGLRIDVEDGGENWGDTLSPLLGRGGEGGGRNADAEYPLTTKHTNDTKRTRGKLYSGFQAKHDDFSDYSQSQPV
jgi:hypothetical protein